MISQLDFRYENYDCYCPPTPVTYASFLTALISTFIIYPKTIRHNFSKALWLPRNLGS